MQVDRHNILWHRQVMSVQWALVSRPVTVAALLGGRWSSPHFDVIFFPLPVILVRLWRMLSAACQRWGNVWRSDNASVLWSVKWWKWPVITGIIKTVRGSSMEGFVYCLALTASQAFGPPLPHTPNECGFVLVGINITTKPPSWNEFTILNKKIQLFFFVCVCLKSCRLQTMCTYTSPKMQGFLLLSGWTIRTWTRAGATSWTVGLATTGF